jgi:serine/threonine protein kinase
MSPDIDAVRATLPAYEIGGELGRGAFGVVLAGSHRHLGRAVAIKQLSNGSATDGEVQARFLAEARVLASMDHPHIVPIFDFVDFDGMCLLVMEHLPGETLSDRMMARSGVDPRFACATAVASASAG